MKHTISLTVLVIIISCSAVSGGYLDDLEKSLLDLQVYIRKSVYSSLKPVRQWESRLRIKFGENGTTVVTYSPSGKKFIIRDTVLYECTGKISDSDGSCSGSLKKFAFKKREDYCYTISYAVIRDWFCIGSSGTLNSGYWNGNVHCESTDGSPTLLIKEKEFTNLCSKVDRHVLYKYFTNIEVKDVHDDVHCTKWRPYVCTISQDFPAFGNF